MARPGARAGWRCARSWLGRRGRWPTKSAPVRPAIDAFERCNRWLLASALACVSDGGSGSDGQGDGGVELIVLWNGAGGNGPGGTRHMIDEVRRRRGRVCWIDTRTL